ncbi:TPA: DNA replication/repair protein RecF [Candidatus Saccharibacteria bacterium]|nr:DNA replication/repair protein RecF [Candidatus Saccharibacteria bacterium]HIO87836.1 DNA replication/repair protein RecF [Candidatus Saccharibacteria bacterium]
MIKSIRLQNFRCFNDKSFDLDPGVNLIVGKNGIGKTTVIEAIYCVLNGGSWRGKDDNLIQHTKDWARVDLLLRDKSKLSLTLDNRTGRLVKKQLINNEPKKTMSLKTVLFEPEFILTFTSQPDKRRNWLDDLIERTHPNFKQIRNNYKRALSQRNRLLKQPTFSSDSIFVWNLKLSEYGAQIAQYRASIIEDIQGTLSSAYNSVSGGTDTVTALYQNQFPVESYSTAHLQKLEDAIEKDKIVGFTTSGPHREDIVFKLNNELVLQTASRGEVRSLAMALKKIELQLLKDETVIELFDDAFSELDSVRSSRLLQNEQNQTIVTSAETRKIGHSIKLVAT